jgi:hypothetical protein
VGPSRDEDLRRMALIRVGDLFRRIDRALGNGDFAGAQGMLADLPGALRMADATRYGPRDAQEEIDDDPPQDPTVRSSHVRGLRPVDVAANEIEPADSAASNSPETPRRR